MMVNVPIRIVVVDDDFRVRESLESLVESAGYHPVAFESAEKFLQSGTLVAATCVITDVRLPGMDGIELQRRIRLERPMLPVVFITAHKSSDEIRQQALDDGAVDFLYKPFHAADLLELLQVTPPKPRGEIRAFDKEQKPWRHSI